MTTVNTVFIESIDPRFDAAACMNCGVCTALCPLEIIPLPRMLFREVMLGLEDKIIENEDTIYSCLLCKMCEANCPAGVPIAENIRLLRNYINSALYGLGR
ncbi:MAG TPA: 4Fe-4S dicluster domain-containing protein [candidate division Zixibacteria bacterium]|nr:4Fe-4S dicluster domain-containing protein [candidate division Zixibacteria bacterium]HEQ98278.1 4Fe-4S dicluster domain-containing protein [candidate division Zixibacteria bacterium]